MMSHISKGMRLYQARHSVECGCRNLSVIAAIRDPKKVVSQDALIGLLLEELVVLVGSKEPLAVAERSQEHPMGCRENYQTLGSLSCRAGPTNIS
jgi:hypothetical protein